MMVLESGLLGAFLALDLFLFYVFWEVMLVPMYFMIGIWGHGAKLYATFKFVLFTMFGSLLMLDGDHLPGRRSAYASGSSELRSA